MDPSRGIHYSGGGIYDCDGVDSHRTPLVARPMPEARRVDWGAFPGRSRRDPAEAPPSAAPANDRVLVRTGGNALQAVSREAVAETAPDPGELLAVSVPSGIRSGQKIMVSVPDGTDRLIEAIVPAGLREGHTFLVRVPPPELFLSEAEGGMADRMGGHPTVTCMMAPYEGGEIPTAPARVASPEPQTVAGFDIGPVPVAHVVSYEGGGGQVPSTRPFRAPGRVASPAPQTVMGVDIGPVPVSHVASNEWGGGGEHVPSPRPIFARSAAAPAGTSQPLPAPTAAGPADTTVTSGLRPTDSDPLELNWCCGSDSGTENDSTRRGGENSASSNPNNGLVLVRVPLGSAPGSTIRVRVDDGRLIEAVVPPANDDMGGEENGSTVAATEFYLRVPPVEGGTATATSARQQQEQGRQNWHDQPLAIAPMAIGPLL